MAGKPKYDWPPREGLIAFLSKYGVPDAARRLGVPLATLRSHMYSEGIKAEEYAPPAGLNNDALQEIANLLA